MLISAVQQSESVIHIYTYFSIFFSVMVYSRMLNIVPCVLQYYYYYIFVGNDQVHSWTLVTSQALDTAWRVVKGSVTLAVSLRAAILGYFRRLHMHLGHRLKWYVALSSLNFKNALAVKNRIFMLLFPFIF